MNKSLQALPLVTIRFEVSFSTILKSFIYLVNHCVQSRHIILHWKNCATPNCPICGSLKKPSALRPQNSIRKLIFEKMK
jgi:hypothetical protein